MLLTETWLEQANSVNSLIESAPPNFDFMSATRTNKRGGGIANIFKTSFQCKQTTFGNFTSFEYLSTLVKCSSSMLLLTIYRPPRLSTPVFLEEFGELLLNICLRFDSLIISGDFNLHVDNPENTYAKEFLTLIDTFSLTQHVQGPTHSHGHTLDLVITKGLNVSTTVRDLAISDNFCVFFDVCMSPHIQNRSMSVRRRAINNGTGLLFEQALSHTPSQPSDCADDLMIHFNSRMTHIMDNIALLKTKRVTDNQKAPWKLNPVVKLLKRECRKSERMWRKSKLQIHYQIHKEMLGKYNLEISKARQSFFSNIINRNINNALLNNYRPISNLPFIGKIIEKIVFNQLTAFLTSNSCFDKFQSGFRANHSTETALIKVINDIHLNSDVGKTSVLVLLDLSAAFYTVDHCILLHRLEHWVGFTGTVINWLKSYLQQRSFFVAIGNCTSASMSLTCGVPQGSILGPLLFNLYMLPLGQIIKNNSVNYHSYADDTQVYLALSPNDYTPLESLCECIDQINNWMSHNFLQLNADKTEVIVFGKKEDRRRITTALETKGLKAKDTVKNLGVFIDSELTFNSHMKAITKSAFYHLKNIAKLRGLTSKQDLEKLVHAFISSRVDYCNGLFTGLPKKTIKQLQLIQNAAARVLTRTKRSDHITPILRSLHWLPVSYRIDFKELLLVFKSLNGMGPNYLLDMFQLYAPTRSLRSRKKKLLVEPAVRTKCGEAAFSCYAVKLWNRPPEDIKNAPTVGSFKSRLKTKLFSDAFC
ncbi:hypothetical protein ACEWY4_010418 [Coilia grayii]|uniref:Reverse transcriptase domain-containing protein n=1 Tax=Coilia grayii TaxID=363190 RepID=A0ABD1K224_9TELE